MSRVCAVDLGQGGQLGETRINVADDIWFGMLCRRDDVSRYIWNGHLYRIEMVGTWRQHDMTKIDWAWCSELVHVKVIS